MDILPWLTTWLQRHPLKAPSALDHPQYTAEVMARVRAIAQPNRSNKPYRLWIVWPRLVTGFAATAAGLVITMSVIHRATHHELAQPSVREVRLAEALPNNDEEAWIEETVTLLEPFDESDPDEWLNELQLLEEIEVSSSS